MRLFHCIVVMGAAVGAGCGGEALPSDSGSRDGSADDLQHDASRGPTRDGESSGETDGGCSEGSAAAALGFMLVAVGCENTNPCVGDSEDPLGPGACAHPQQLACADDPPYKIISTLHGCTCDTTAPLVPTDCPQTAQFKCTDWTIPCGCWCDSNAPTSASDCTRPPSDAAVPWTCHSYDPPVGCECFTLPPPIL